MVGSVNRYDIAVVGNGALGLFLADRLARRRWGTIAVIGHTDRRLGASNAAGAMLGCFGEVTKETFAVPASRRKFEAGLTAHRLWDEVIAELDEDHPGDPSVRTSTDTFVVLNTRGGELDSGNYAATLQALRTYNEPHEEVDPADIPGYRPRPDLRALRAVRLPAEGAVDSRRVLQRMQTRVERANVSVLDAEVKSLTMTDGRVDGAELADGTRISAGFVVVAAGAASGQVLGSVLCADEMMPTFAGLGFALVTHAQQGAGFASVVRTPNRAFACGLHVVPLGGGREYLGATNAVVEQASSEPFMGDAHFLTECAMQQLDERIFHHRIEGTRVGNRPVSLDGFPLIGWTGRAGLYVMTGTYRDGFHSSPMLAEYVADELEGKVGELAEIYDPMREPIRCRTVEKSVEEFVEHRLAAWFEAGSQSPPQVPAQSLADSFRDQANAFYQRTGIQYGLGPDILMHLLTSLRERRTAQVMKYLRGLAPSGR